MARSSNIVLAACVLGAWLDSTSSLAGPMERIVERAFQPAILKVDVTFRGVSLFDKDKNNICQSKGTAFVIGDSYAVTATHVYKIDPRCGEPVIKLVSNKLNYEVFANPVHAHDDVSLLKIDGVLPSEICALALRPDDVQHNEGVRFGIPAKLDHPVPIPVNIQDDLNFHPYVGLSALEVEKGESGGPVLYVFQVAGVMRAKHSEYSAYSVMSPIKILRKLLIDNKVVTQRKLCNPVEVNVFRADGLNTFASVRLPYELDQRSKIELEDNIKLYAAVQGQMTRRYVHVGRDGTMSDQTILVGTESSSESRNFGQPKPQVEKRISDLNREVVESVTDSTSRTTTEYIWRGFIASLKKEEVRPFALPMKKRDLLEKLQGAGRAVPARPRVGSPPPPIFRSPPVWSPRPPLIRP